MKRILFVFLDGVGLGPKGPNNPFHALGTTSFDRLAGGQPWTRPFTAHVTERHVAVPLDATLDTGGLPQSGTGQATLLSGRNCAEVVGRHFGPFPHSATYDIIDTHGLFQQVNARSDVPPPAFANAFPPRYFERSPRRRATVTTRACTAADVPLRDIHDLRDGRALAADLTGAVWRNRLHRSVPRRTESDAAHVLRTIGQSHSLTFFEYFLTDKVGHKRRPTSPNALLSQLDTFFETLVRALNPKEETLIVTSDHGNLEDTSHTQHTRNEVPLIVVGWAAPYFHRASSLTDVTPQIVEALEQEVISTPHREGAG